MQGSYPGTSACTASAPTVTCTITGLAAGTTYNYLITASNAYGEGVVSSTAFSVETSTIPDAIATAATTTYSGSTVAVTWSASANTRSNAVIAYSIQFR